MVDLQHMVNQGLPNSSKEFPTYLHCVLNLFCLRLQSHTVIPFKYNYLFEESHHVFLT
jgi:hypothetical protein